MSATGDGARPPARAARVRWERLLPVVLCAAYLWLVFCLALWVVGPLVGLRWQPILIGADSMEPAIRAGDVVLLDRAVAQLGPGDVITYEDPVWPDELVTHRVVEVLDGGRYQTKGDASAVEDSTPIPLGDILGVARLLVPLVGLPLVWLRDAPAVAAAWALVTTLAWVCASRLGSLTAPADAARAGAPVPARRLRLPAALRRWAGPRPVAGSLRRWCPPLVAAMASFALVTDLGLLALAVPVAVLALDPRGPHVPIGRWQLRWRTGRVTRRLKPLPLGGAVTTVAAVTVTILSTATFTAATPSSANSFAAATIASAGGLAADVVCDGGTPTVELSWTASPSVGVEGYLLDRDGTALGPVTPGTASTATDAGAGNGTTHTYTLRAYAGSWTSPPSTATVTPDCVAAPPSSGVVASSGTVFELAVPSTVQAGDLLLSVLVVDNADEGYPVPAGWTLRRHARFNGLNVVVFYRIADASDAGTTSTFTKPQANGVGTLVAYTGIDPADPFVDGGVATSSATDAVTAPSVASEAGGTVVGLYGLDVVAALTAPPETAARVYGSGNGWSLLVADEAALTAGATGTRTAAASVAGDGIGILEALRPAPLAFAAARSGGTSGANGRLDPSSLVPIGGGHALAPTAARAFAAMRQALLDDVGVDLVDRITDSYRTYAQQAVLAEAKGLYAAGGLAAVPGSSNHGLGLAVDLDVSGAVGGWLHERAAEFGFATIPREPWHWEYST